jgi:hypothetical protein
MTLARRLTGVIAGVLAWSAASSVALACPICFQMEEGPMTKGVLTAVFVLMTVTIGVLGAFAKFVLKLTRTPELTERSEPRNLAEPRNLTEPA